MQIYKHCSTLSQNLRKLQNDRKTPACREKFSMPATLQHAANFPAMWKNHIAEYWNGEKMVVMEMRKKHSTFKFCKLK